LTIERPGNPDVAVSSDKQEVKMPSIFELIVAGEIPCHKIWEDDDHLAFLDINPRIEGHTLVIPKKPWFEVFAMDEDPYIALWSAARTVARHLQETTGCARVVIVVLGYEVEHVHIHLMPTNNLEDFPFPPVDQAALARIEETAQKLRA
jgi:histidine triad (HIT) family protein